jgi:hypothetical protein
MINKYDASHQLQHPWPLVFRIGYVIVLLACLFFLLTGISPQVQAYTTGYTGAVPSINEAGEVVLEVTPDSDAEDAGLNSGDILLVINGQALTDTQAGIEEQLSGPVGEQVSLTVRTQDGSESTVQVIRSSRYLKMIEDAGLTPIGAGRYFSSLSVIVGLIFGLLGAVLLFRKNLDRLIVLASFVLLLFPYSLKAATSAYYGAVQSNLNWLYYLLFATGLLLTCLLMLLFPNWKYIPAWTRWIAILIGLWMVPYLVALFVPNFLPGSLLDIIWMAILALTIVLQVFKQKNFLSGDEKRLTHPLLAGTLTALVTYLVLYLASSLGVSAMLGGGWRYWYYLISELILDAALLYFGFCLVRSLQRTEK